MNQSAIDTLLEAATLAPSGDNTQPWRFAVDREHWTVSVEVDPTRDPSPMNAGQRMAWIAVGAAVENMIRTAEKNSWAYEILDAGKAGNMRLQLQPTSTPGTIDPVIRARVTNRRVFDATPIPADGLNRLQEATGQISGVEATWIVDRSILGRLAKLIARADALMLGTKSIRDAFLAKVRFDQPVSTEVDAGLSLGSLEVSSIEQKLLRLMVYVPDVILRPLGGRRIFAGVAEKLAHSATGVCLIRAEDSSAAGQVRVGRLWQRAWLALTQDGFAAQPMMSLCVLRNIQEQGEREIVDQVGRDALETLLRDFERLESDLGMSVRTSAIMRFGFAPPPSARTGRLRLEQSCSAADSSVSSQC